MTSRFQYAILAIVYGLIALVGMSLLYPALTEDTEKSTDVAQHLQQKTQLDVKLQDRLKVAQEKQALEADIASLRNAVPKDADVDLLLIDLEKLAVQAGVDLIGVETPGADDVKASQKDIMDMLGKPDPKNSTAVDKKTQVSQAKSKPADIGSELGLQQIDREIFVTGNYGSMVQFIRNIESYERVMGVSHVVIAVPKQDGRGGESDKSSDRGKKLKLNQPVMSFLLSIYYLP